MVGNPNMHQAATAVLVSFVLSATILQTIAPAYAQDEDIPRCSLLEFDPKCSPSGWMSFLMGEVAIALVIAVILFRLQNKTESKIANAVREIQKIVRDREESRKKNLIFVTQAMKNYFSVILMISGLMNHALAKAEVYEDVPANIRNKQGDLVMAMKHANDVLNLAVQTIDPLLSEQLHRFLNKVEAINPEAGVGKGFPEYDSIKKEIAYLTEKLDAMIGSDNRVLK